MIDVMDCRHTKAKELLYTRDSVDAAEGYHLGGVVLQEQLMAEAIDMTEKGAEIPLFTLKTTK